MMTGHPGIFAGGDMVPGERTVTVGIGHGKLAARNIDAWLRGEQWVHPPTPRARDFDKLNTWYYSDAPKSQQPVLDMIRRQSTFEEVVGGFDETTAQFEARRCLSCGNCFECDNCYGVCPDNAVIKLGAGQALRVQLRLLQGLRAVRQRVPVRRDPHACRRRSRKQGPVSRTVTQPCARSSPRASRPKVG